MRIAIVHDWLKVYSGAESTLSAMLEVFPQADLFSLVDFLPSQHRKKILDKKVKTSFIQKLPFAKKMYRHYLPLMPIAVEQFDMSSYDLVISSTHAVAKGVVVGPGQLHICMCYSPIRYAWDLSHQYLRESGLKKGLKGILAKFMLHKMRIWDARTANGVDEFIAISHFIKQRINKIYRRDATVIYPPVNIEDFTLCEYKEDYYVTVSRFVPYKKIDMIVKAFALMPEKKLIVIGDGPDFKKVDSIKSANVQLMGYLPLNLLKEKIQKAKAFIFAAIEDFGIAPLEAQACGTPVIGYAKGGLLETITSETGMFFYDQTPQSIAGTIKEFEKKSHEFSPQKCRENALRFSHEHFKIKFKDFVMRHVHDYEGINSCRW
jgi:glycosyltransferase involved in cell wall biosynthesis